MAPPGGWALLAALLVPACSLQCDQCWEGLCAPVPCAPHQQRCRSTLLSTTDASGRVLRREERGCAVSGVPDVTVVTFVSRGRAVTLREERCGGERCNRPLPPEPPPAPGPPRFCPSCSAADGSCGRPPLALRCPRPGDVCLDLTTRLGGEEPGDDRIRGCGQAGPCRGLLGFDSGPSLYLVRCCNGTRCGTEAEPPPSGLRCWACEGPAPDGCRPTALQCRGGLTHCVLADTYGAVGLQCLSCGGDAGGCREAANVTCDAESDVCAEGLAAVTWSHGRFALGARGCGRGQVGANDRALELFGLVVFAQRRQCGEGGCNRQLPLGGDGALPLPGNESARVPNGVWCYGCPPEGPCPPDNGTVVQCYDDLRGCFHGNVTLTLGSVSLWREVRGCVRDESCTQAARGDGGAVALRGSCCSGNLCNRHLANKTFFAPDLPRLELLPHGHAHTPTPHATKVAAADAKVAGDAAKTAGDAAKTADDAAKMADDDAKMAASARAANGSAEEANRRPGGAASRSHGAAVLANGTAMLANGTATKANGGATKANGATTQANTAADRATKATKSKGATMAANGANGGANGANSSINLANVNVNAAKANGAAVDPKTAAVDPKTAAVDPKMAAGDAGTAAGRPAGHWERKTGVKLPVDGGHAVGGPGWLLPLLLLALL